MAFTVTLVLMQVGLFLGLLDNASITIEHTDADLWVTLGRGNPGVTWKGVVEEIPDQVVSRRLKPQDPGRPSDTRVLLVKVALLETAPIVLGQRIEVEILAAEKTK